MTDKTVFQGTGQGFHGPVVASLTIEEGKITQAESQHSEQAYVGNLGIQRVLETIHQQGNLEVDAVSGATFSTKAYLNAAQKAYATYQNEISEEQAMDATFNIAQTSETVDAISGASVKAYDTVENTSPVTPTVPYEEGMIFEEEYDAIVVGSGGAGLSAAVEIARAGQKVLICEKAGIPGGTTNYSGGVIQAAGTKYQKEFTPYKEDTPDNHAELWLKAGEELVDADLVRDLAHGAPDNIEWLSEMGLKWTSLYGHTHIPYVPKNLEADRIHVYENGGAGGSGTLLIMALLKAAQEAGAEITYDCPVISLVQDLKTKKVYGVKVKRHGQEALLSARKGVVLATASVDHNPALAKELNPQQFTDLKYHTVLSAASDTGDGIIMGMDTGAAIMGMGGCIDFDGVTGNATSTLLPTMPMIYVNGQGRRFVCEDATYAYGYRAIFQQEKQFNKATYMIFGENAIGKPGCPWTRESLVDLIKSGKAQHANSAEELAGKIGVPADNLKQSIYVWNNAVRAGKDLEFDRRTGLAPIEGHLFALPNHATNLGSLGGLKINVDTQVLDRHGKVIDNLYAAGLNAGGWIGSYYPGSGTAIAGIVHQGRKAGQHIAKK